ncbi:hypothetical protein BDB01DRAFT_854047 [Pilobolus umbonatus]|nr:hypothetical protein BDB01DRAFT_854047 [Pilobolus umbonatus]
MSGILRLNRPVTRCFSSSAVRASSLNKVQLIGYVGGDPRMNELSGDRRVYNYTVATSEVKPDKEGNIVKQTQWHQVHFFAGSDWFSKVKKGDLVYVEGSLRYNQFTDKEGVDQTRAEIRQNAFRLLKAKNTEEEEE